MYKSTP